MRYSELKRKLRRFGCNYQSEGGRHEMWYSPITGKIFPVGRHNSEDVKSGTLRQIEKESGVKLS